MKNLTAFLAGLIFSIGLIISGMVNPAKVLGFLDFAGHWDASLAFVMGGAVLVTYIGFKLVLKRDKPWFASEFSVPTRKDIDSALIIGPTLFGLGWGLVGLCPGPSIASLTAGQGQALISSVISSVIFFGAMIAGMIAVRVWQNRAL